MLPLCILHMANNIQGAANHYKYMSYKIIPRLARILDVCGERSEIIHHLMQ